MNSLKNNPCVEILLSTFNGERYLEEQLNSIFSQTYNNIKLIVRDDGSTDRTIEILNKFAQENQSTMQVDCGVNVGVKESFNKLLAQSSERYVGFCDQDDIWLDDKVEKSMSTLLKIQSSETKSNTPSLVYSDMECINEKGDRLGITFSEKHGVDITDNKFNDLIVQNVVAGTSCLFNRELLRVAFPVPNSIYHDWWFALNASIHGKIAYTPSANLQYRLHENNVVGASSLSVRRVVKMILQDNVKLRIKEILKTSRFMAETILERNEIKNIHSEMFLNEFLKMDTLNPVAKRAWLFKNSVSFSSRLRTFALVLFV